MEDIIIVAILIILVALISLYIYKEKKKGKACIGCPYGASCAAKQQGKGCPSKK